MSRAALVAASCLLVLLLVRPARADTGSADGCPDPALAAYASRPYATKRGIRRRCALLEVIARGKQALSPRLRERVLKELSNRFAVEMSFDGAVGLSREAVDYLLRYMPEAAALVSAYSRTRYTATQVDGPRGPASFFVTDGHRFAAEFAYLLSHRAHRGSEYMFFESGRAEVLFWNVWGNSFIRYGLHPDHQGGSRYHIEVHIFTRSRFLRVILDSELFRYFAHRMFKDILDDVQSAVHKFAAEPNPGGALPAYFVSGLESRLRAAPPGAGSTREPRPRSVPWRN